MLQGALRRNFKWRMSPFQASNGDGGVESQGWLFIETKTGLTDNSLWIFPE